MTTNLAKYRKNHIITIGNKEYQLVEDPSFIEGKREVIILEVAEKEDIENDRGGH